jgi:hypothetical protein
VDALGGRLYGLQRRGLENDSQDDLNLNTEKEDKQEKRSGPRSLRASNPCGLRYGLDKVLKTEPIRNKTEYPKAYLKVWMPFEESLKVTRQRQTEWKSN